MDLPTSGNHASCIPCTTPRAELLRRNTRRDTSLSNKTLTGMPHRWDLPLPTEAHRVTYAV